MTRGLLLMALLLGCGGSTEPPSAAGPRRARARREGTVVTLTDTPGALTDGNAPPPVPGSAPVTHTALSASCDGDALGCSEAGRLVREAETFDAALEALRGVGFEVVTE